MSTIDKQRQKRFVWRKHIIFVTFFIDKQPFHLWACPIKLLQNYSGKQIKINDWGTPWLVGLLKAEDRMEASENFPLTSCSTEYKSNVAIGYNLMLWYTEKPTQTCGEKASKIFCCTHPGSGWSGRQTGLPSSPHGELARWSTIKPTWLVSRI